MKSLSETAIAISCIFISLVLGTYFLNKFGFLFVLPGIIVGFSAPLMLIRSAIYICSKVFGGNKEK